MMTYGAEARSETEKNRKRGSNDINLYKEELYLKRNCTEYTDVDSELYTEFKMG